MARSPRPPLWGWDGYVQGLLLLAAGSLVAFVTSGQLLVEAVTRDGTLARLGALGGALAGVAVGCALGWIAVLYVLRPVEREEPPPSADELRDAGLAPAAAAVRDGTERRAWRSRGYPTPP